MRLLKKRGITAANEEEGPRTKPKGKPIGLILTGFWV